MDTLELLAHPVRLRIIHTLRGGREATTGELCERIPDVSKATVYRHVELLAEAGIIEVAGERRVRGAVERRFRLRPERASIAPAAAAALTRDDHRRGFATAMATLAAEFNAYLDRDATDLARDPVGYRQHAVWLSPEEVREMVEGMRAAILPHLGNEAGPGRALYMLSPVLFPIEAEAGEDVRE